MDSQQLIPTKPKWYKRKGWIIALLILFYPVGLFLMWKYSDWKKWVKIAISVFFLIIFVGSVSGNDSPKNNISSSQNSSPTPTPTIPSEVAISNAQETVIPTQTQVTPTIAPVVAGETALVSRVIDGDTIELSTGDRVRYIGMDTPEPSQSECYSSEATKQNSSLVLNQQVRLEKDVSETDRYGRLLRYVYVGDVFVNDYLVRQGYANASSYPPDVKYQAQFTQAESEARSANRGLWSACQTNAQPSSSQTTKTGTVTTQTQSGCNIKGNISADGEKIYHYPGCQSYEKTKIDTSKGERWFCSETEAVEAGWRKAGNCR